MTTKSSMTPNPTKECCEKCWSCPQESHCGYCHIPSCPCHAFPTSVGGIKIGDPVPSTEEWEREFDEKFGEWLRSAEIEIDEWPRKSDEVLKVFLHKEIDKARRDGFCKAVDMMMDDTDNSMPQEVRDEYDALKSQDHE